MTNIRLFLVGKKSEGYIVCMTREEFIKALEEKEYPYEIEGNKIVVTHRNSVDLDYLTSLPTDVEFRNRGPVYLGSLKTLPPGVQFGNTENVWLTLLKTIPSGVLFKNEGNIYLGSLFGGWFGSWEGNAKGISPNRLLNKMVADGLFDRR